ncbi:MAG: nodulation protein NfeD [Burkholderiaceae bacterium]
MTTLRGFCWAGLMLLTLSGQASPVPVLQLQDAIGPASADYIVRGIAKAAKAQAPLLVIELDTPGGLDTSMRQIIQAILASPVAVAVYVRPEGARAASAGTYILYAAHIAAMAPATTLGAATPVAIAMPGSGVKPAPAPHPGLEAPADKTKNSDTLSTKQINDAAALIRGLAQMHGRNAVWAERAVREAVSLTANEALKDKVIDMIAKDLDDLLTQIDGRTVQLVGVPTQLMTRGLAFQVQPPDWRHRLLSIISQPSMAMLLMMLGVYALLFELASPSFGVAGVVGAICLLLALFALQMLPINYAGLALLLLAVALFVAELMAPSFGLLGAGGILAFVIGGMLLFDNELPGFGVPLSLLMGLALLSGALVIFGGGLALKLRRRPVIQESWVGACGVMLEVGDQQWVEVLGERWRVSSPSPMYVGQTVRVTGRKGMTLEVQVDNALMTKGNPS